MEFQPQSHWSRRDTLRAALAAGAGMVAPGIGSAAAPAMLQRQIPRRGGKLPAIGLGTWQVFDIGHDAAERAAAKEVLRLFVEAGGRVIDSSPMYGNSETVVGDLAAELGVRDTLFFATKVWTSGREAGIAQMRESMRRMRVQRIDLMQVHNLVDVHTHLATLAAWQKEGKVRYVGITHYHSGAYGELEQLLRSESLDFLQVNYSLGEREAESRILPLAAERGLAVLINRPFGKGALFSRVRGKPLPEWAGEIDCSSWAQFFLKWILGHEAVSCAIPATRNPKHLLDNMGAGVGRLPDAAMRRRMAEHFERL